VPHNPRPVYGPLYSDAAYDDADLARSRCRADEDMTAKVLAAAHDPALGDDASVNRGAFVDDLLAAIRSREVRLNMSLSDVEHVALHIERWLNGR
jgi:hypothetical protein